MKGYEVLKLCRVKIWQAQKSWELELADIKHVINRMINPPFAPKYDHQYRKYLIVRHIVRRLSLAFFPLDQINFHWKYTECLNSLVHSPDTDSFPYSSDPDLTDCPQDEDVRMILRIIGSETIVCYRFFEQRTTSATLLQALTNFSALFRKFDNEDRCKYRLPQEESKMTQFGWVTLS